MGLKLITAIFICMALYEATEGASWSKCKPTPKRLLDQGWPPCFMEKRSRRGSSAKSCRGCVNKAIKPASWSECKKTPKNLRDQGWGPCFMEKKSRSGSSSKSCTGCVKGSGGTTGGATKPAKPYRGTGVGKRANNIGDVASECKKAHNFYRRKYGNRKDLTYSKIIAKGAADWALKMADTKKFAHSATDYGENLYYAGGNIVSDKDAVWNAVGKWYSEIYNWLGCKNGKGKTNGTTGHFTAIVWKSTTAVGCGVARRRASTYVVGRYNPAGNMRGAYCRNV